MRRAGRMGNCWRPSLTRRTKRPLKPKASSVRPRERVANWLHGVALRTAMKAKAMTAKRRGREKQVTEMPEPETAQQGQWRDLQPLLDQELNGKANKRRIKGTSRFISWGFSEPKENSGGTRRASVEGNNRR